MRTRTKVLLTVAVLLVVGGYSFYRWHRYTYPYGWSHCCDFSVWFCLREYAEAHGGRFPVGEVTPEASLSLLYRAGLGHPGMLCGKTVPEAVVREILERGELLGPETCGWHYVEGLTLADDPRLALFWDKAGLGHNGQRLPNGDHYVGFIGQVSERIPGEKWAEFLQEQEKLRQSRSKEAIQAIPLLSAKVRLPSGQVVDQYDAPGAIHDTNEYDSGSGSSSSGSGMQGLSSLTPAALRWWSLAELGMGRVGEGTLTLTLTLGEWQSKAVRIKVSNGVVVPRSFIFEMSAPSTDQPQGPAAPGQLR